MTTTEKNTISIGFMPLSDCAPLIVAQQLGFFAKQNLNVRLVRQNSWATLRDKLNAGLLDMAQMLAPMPIASQLGLGVTATLMRVPMVLSYNGNGITLSRSIFDELLSANQVQASTILKEPVSAEMLLPLLQSRKAQNLPKLRFATVFPYSCHYYQLASWLYSGGISLDDVDISIVPPAAMVDAMLSGDIDGFCVGSPWNAAAVRVGIGVTVIASQEIWQNSPEKVLGVTQAWAAANPQTLSAAVLALKQACEWLSSIPNRFEAARLLAQERYVATSLDNITPAFIDSCITCEDYAPRHVKGHTLFSVANSGNEPTAEQAMWLLQQMQRCGQVTINEDEAMAIQRIFNCN